MTDKQQDTRNDTQKAAGELQGRARRNEHTEDRRQDRTRHGDGETEGDTRQPRNTRQAGADRQKKEYVIFKGDKERKTPLRLAKACKRVHIHFTQYRGAVAVYCTFFYIL